MWRNARQAKTKILGEPGRCGVARPKRANQAKDSRQSKYCKLSKRRCRAEGHRDDIADNRSGCGPCKMILSSFRHAARFFIHAQTGVKGTKVPTNMKGDRWAKIKAAARDPSNSIWWFFRNLLRVVIPVAASSTVHTVLLFLLRSYTQRLPTTNAQIATRNSNQRAFLPLSLAFAHRARIPSEIVHGCAIFFS
jgi:hypothetical protein